ncbi:MAG: FAD:protein FMN transferase [Oscillospiraceae bacterium]|jgi:thiamine biosynthesis lipoprotein|nr:FAD:protein FMN transferase [Oscillospiraceae bacterium]
MRRKAWILLLALLLSLAACDAPHHQWTFLAMDTVVSVDLQGGLRGVEALEAVGERMAVLDAQLDRFTAVSEIARINHAAGEAVPISEELRGWLTEIQAFSAASDGALDVTLGKLSDLWDFGAAKPKMPDPSEVQARLQAKRGLEITDKGVRVGADAALDLGAVGKGIACDEIARILQEKGTKRAVVSIGGSILLWGADTFRVGIRTPDGAAGESFATLQLTGGGAQFVSTSGRYERGFDLNGMRYHHILDPQTGAPVQNGLVSVTVIAPTGWQADALSTACFVLGIHKSRALLSNNHAAAVFVDEQQRVFVLGEVSMDITDARFVRTEATP